MANIKDDPKVQELLAKAEEKSEKAQEKAAKSAKTEAAKAAKEVIDAFIETAKTAEMTQKDLVKALGAVKKDLSEAIKA